MKTTFFLLAIFGFLDAKSQNYLLSFAGTGATTTVNTVKVENLTKGTSLILNGSDNLQLTLVTGISSSEYRKSQNIKIYPNPSTDNFILQLCPPANGNAVLSIIETTGKVVAQKQIYLESCSQKFCISGLSSGSYLVRVMGKTYQYSEKFLSEGRSTGDFMIEKIGISQAYDQKNKIHDSNSKGVQATVDMEYSIGDRLKYTGISGNFSTVKTDIPSGDKVFTFNFIACTDGSNNNYSVVEIGTQIWMAENLRTTRYQNGELVENYWAYDDNESNVAIYGRLYNWYTATDTRSLCPASWHIPDDGEWLLLSNYLGGGNGGKMKETGTIHWDSPNTGATNESGFSGLPGGYRGQSGPDGPYIFLRKNGQWWSSTSRETYAASKKMLRNDLDSFQPSLDNKDWGLSVRCIKD